MIDDRVGLGTAFLDEEGVTCVTIDDFEVHDLWYVLSRYFSAEDHIGTAAIRNNPQGRATLNGLRIKHEYALFFSRRGSGAKVGRLERTAEQNARYDEVDEEGLPYLWENFRKTGTDSQRSDRPKQYYPIYVKDKAWRVPKTRWQSQRRELEVLEAPDADEKVLWPKDESGTERVWKWGFDRLAEYPLHLKIEDVGGTTQAYNRNYLNQEGSLPGTWWEKPQYAAGSHGTNLLTAMFGTGRGFLFPKSVYAVVDCLRVGGAVAGVTCLDFFAGSGTTGHAVINMNREDNGGRKYILMEMGEYFPTVLLPRLKKAIYCADWSGGKPAGGDGISQTIKYHTLEQYEDTLNNLDVESRAAQAGQAALKYGDEYLLQYMLDFETQGSQSLLNLDALADPFLYNLFIKQGDNVKPTPHPVDLVETFNYLLGLTVIRLRVFQGDGGREYRAVLGEKDGKRVAVVWRSSRDLAGSDAALAGDKAYITDTLLPSLLGAGVTQDRLYVNSPCAVTGAEAIEPEFKRLMFGEAL